MTTQNEPEDIFYNPDKLIYRPIFTQNELDYLEALHSTSRNEDLLEPRNIQDFSISFAYTSAVLEGNTYTALQADVLLRSRVTPPEEKYLDETFMIVNMHKSFWYAVREASYSDNATPFKQLVKNLHILASENILDNSRCGVVRSQAVTIGGSSYRPSYISQELEDGLNTIANEYGKINNAFEKAVYVHQNLAYLQYFIDHNKRTARNMAAYTLLKAGKTPVMFTEKSKNQYASAMLDYYESPSADYSSFKEYFISVYEKVCTRLNPRAIDEAKGIVGTFLKSDKF